MGYEDYRTQKAKELNPKASNEEIFDMMIKIENEEFAKNRKSWQEKQEREKKQNRQYKKSKKDNH